MSWCGEGDAPVTDSGREAEARVVMNETIGARVDEVRERISAAQRRAGRAPDSVRLVAATKVQSVASIEAVLAAGVADLGENRAQELVAKTPELARFDPVWHFIGRLQRNKINQLKDLVTWWQSIDSPDLADALTARVPSARVLVEVNVDAAPQKGGCAPTAVPALVDHLRGHGAHVAGLMTVAPAGVDARPTFALVRELAERLELDELSMGMSGDFEVAVEEGATLVRVGTGLFGLRPTFPQSRDPGR